jgi:hypothetical protein
MNDILQMKNIPYELTNHVPELPKSDKNTSFAIDPAALSILH